MTPDNESKYALDIQMQLSEITTSLSEKQERISFLAKLQHDLAPTEEQISELENLKSEILTLESRRKTLLKEAEKFNL